MIVKNEEALLGRCLDSIKSLPLTIVDTGSKDSTIEIAKSYGANVHEFKWVDDFSKARNFAISKCTNEFILVIDADEVLTKGLDILKDFKGDKDVYSVEMISEDKTSRHNSPRLFRNSGIKYVGAVHEVLDKLAEDTLDITIEYGYSPAHALDPDIDFRILKKAVKENPSLIRERFYLAREYFYKGQWEKCIKELNKYIKVATWLPERNEAYLLKAKCLDQLGRYEQACDSVWGALKYNANFKEALEFLANHMDKANGDKWREFSKLANNRDVLFVR